MPSGSFCLLVTNGPFAGRAARADLDVAMAAAAMGHRLEVYFLRDALLQLSTAADGAAALLPAGLRAWSALPELGEVRIFAEQGRLDRWRDLGLVFPLPVEALDEDGMRTRWRTAEKVMVV